MTRPLRFTTRHAERGNVFAMLFGAVALTGVLAAVSMQTLTGPVTTITRVTQRNVAENNLLMNGKILINAAVAGVSGGDADADGIIEPAPFIAPGGGEVAPTNGGFLPTDLGLALTDPWGSKYGYCVWDHGTTNSSANRITGDDTVSASTQPVIAIIAAGPDKTFQTSCPAWSGGPVTVSKGAGSDDLIEHYTYAEATASSNGLWSLNASDQAKAELKDSGGTVNVTIDRSTGIGDFLGITTDTLVAKTSNVTLDGGLKLDTETNVTACTAADAGVIRYNAASGKLEVCNGTAWRAAGSDLWLGTGTHIYSGNTGNVGIGTNTPAQKLDVVGNAAISGNSTTGGTLGVTGATSLGNTLSVTGAATLSSTLAVTGAATLASTLDVTGSTTIAGDLTVDTNTLFIDAANDKVGIGTATPVSQLQVGAQIPTYSPAVTIRTDTPEQTALRVQSGGGAASAFVAHRNSDSSVLFDIKDNGNVGIGTATPSYLLDVNGTARFAGAATLSNTLSVAGNTAVDIDTLFVDVAANTVGIGTATPAAKLDVVGGVKIGADAVCNASKAGMVAWNTNQFQVCDGTAFRSVSAIEKLDDIGDVYVSEAGTPNNNDILAWNATDSRWEAKNVNTVGSAVADPGGLDKQVQFNDGGTLAGAAQLYWDKANNRLGIGTASPTASLHVKLPAAGVNIRLDKDATNPQILFANAGTDKWGIYQEAATDSFRLRNWDDAVDALVIDDTNKVGIGTDSPQSLLQVAGGIQLGDDTATCPGASNVKLGTLRFNGGNLQVCKSTGWSGVGSGSGSGTIFSARQSLTLGTVYGPAATDGLVVAIGRHDGSTGLLTLSVNADTSNPPTTQRAFQHSQNASTTYYGSFSMTVPVMKGEYYRILCNGAASCPSPSFVGSPNLYFVPVTGGDTLAGLSCSSGEIPKWNGSAWACAADDASGGGSSPSFFVHRNGANETVTANAWSPITWTTEAYDTANNFASNKFTAPSAGKYVFTFNVYCVGLGVGNYCHAGIYKNGALTASNVGSASSNASIGNGNTVSAVLDLAAGDEVEPRVYIYTNTTVDGRAYFTNFSGGKLGGGGSDTLAGLSCSSGEVPQWDGTDWICGTGSGGSSSGNIVTGSYTGNGAASQSITLGFRPKMVIVKGINGTYKPVGVAIDGIPDGAAHSRIYASNGVAADSTQPKITATGFDSYGNTNDSTFNYSGTVYHYVAVKDGGGTGLGSTQVAFEANKNGANQTVTANTWTKLTFPNEVYDVGNAFDTATSRFTPSVAGKYVVTMGAYCMGTATACSVMVYKNGAGHSMLKPSSAAETDLIPRLTTIVDMNGTTDYLEAYAYTGGTIIGGANMYTAFSAALIGGGGSATAAGTVAGAVQFNDGSDAFAADDVNLVWDDTNNRLGIGTAVPERSLSLTGGNIGFQESAQARSIVWGPTASPQKASIDGSEGASSYLAFATASAERLRIDSNGGVSVGSGAGANASSLLDLTSTTKGFLPPRMTTAQRDAISSPAEGLVIYNTTTKSLDLRVASSWLSFGGSMTGNTMVTGWPDIIRCNVDTWGQSTFYPMHVPHTSGSYIYRSIWDGAGTDYSFVFTSAGAYQTTQNLPTNDCNGKSISQLYSEGKAFNFVGGATASADGSAGQIQFNEGGNLKADAALHWDNTNKRLGIGTATPTAAIEVSSSSTNSTFVHLNNTAASGRKWTIYSSGGGPAAAGTFGIYDTTASASRLNIDASGNVGVGTTAPNGKLHVIGNMIVGPANVSSYGDSTHGGVGIQGDGVNGRLFITSSSSYIQEFNWQPTGTRVGSITITGSATSYNTTSDRRLKKNIGPTARGLDTLLRINVKDFNFIGDEAHGRVQGFIAQDLYEVYPEAVTTNGDDGAGPLENGKGWAVDYGRLTPLLVKSVQDLKADNDNLRAELKAANDNYIKQLNELRTRMQALERTTKDLVSDTGGDHGLDDLRQEINALKAVRQ